MPEEATLDAMRLRGEWPPEGVAGRRARRAIAALTLTIASLAGATPALAEPAIQAVSSGGTKRSYYLSGKGLARYLG